MELGRILRQTCFWCLLLAGGTSCAGTQWGESIEQAIQVSEQPGVESSDDVLTVDAPRETPRPTPDQEPAPEPTTVSEDTSAPDTFTPSDTPTPANRSQEGTFRDLEAAPAQAQEAIQALTALGVFDSITGSMFEPNRSVKRGEFARWLVLANNAIYTDDPLRQIRLGSAQDRPMFLDVPEADPNFLPIQALGAAGIIIGNDQQEFRPDSLLSRADLIQLKLPLDLPPGQIEGDRESVEQVWGFTDIEEIPQEALPAVTVDRELDDDSTILRTFGPIRSFRPFSPVSRAEVALALSQFGEQSALELTLEPSISQDPSPIPALSPSPSPAPSPSPSPAPSPSPLPTPEPSVEPEPDSPEPEPNNVEETPTSDPSPSPTQGEPDVRGFVTPPRTE